jgi:hypothetical protein
LTGSPGFDRVIESPELIFLNQNDIVLVKKKLTGCNRVLPDHTGFFLSLFFLQPGPIPALGPGPDRVSKL